MTCTHDRLEPGEFKRFNVIGRMAGESSEPATCKSVIWSTTADLDASNNWSGWNPECESSEVSEPS